jgi:hypothetical protein
VTLHCFEDTQNSSTSGIRRRVALQKKAGKIDVLVDELYATSVQNDSEARAKILAYLHSRRIFCSYA